MGSASTTGRDSARSRWVRLVAEVPADRRDVAVTALWSLGTIGLEEQRQEDVVRIHAYFDNLPPGAEDLLAGEVVLVDEVVEADWMAQYRRWAEVVLLGSRFAVDPREPGSGQLEVADRKLLLLPARSAFGTGSHESTRLVVEWLEDQSLDGLAVVDVGTGTGILAFAALHLGAATVVAVEIDPQACFMAFLNQALNSVAFPLVVGRVDALDAPGAFDLALVNVLPEKVGADVEQIANLLRLGGRAVFSGVLTERADVVERGLEAHGFRALERRTLGEWSTLITERSAGRSAP